MELQFQFQLDSRQSPRLSEMLLFHLISGLSLLFHLRFSWWHFYSNATSYQIACQVDLS